MRCGALLLLGASSSRARTPPPPARSLRRAPVGVADPREQRRAQLGLGEARLDRGPRDRDERGVAPPEALAGDRVLAADGGAEVRRGGRRPPEPYARRPDGPPPGAP